MAFRQIIQGSVAAALVVGSLAGCGTAVSTAGGGDGDGSNTTTGGGPGPTNEPAATYPGKGFIVHEWGTDTIVVGSDGSLQRGLHHEEEDLPPFVYDRIKAGTLEGSTSAHVKMETPVAYFYSDKPLTASVSVAFPKGVLTQWYPAVKAFAPMIVGPNAIFGMDKAGDPVFDLNFPFQGPSCAEKFSAVAGGLLDWGTIEILPRDAVVPGPEAPLDAFTWSYARDVASNGVRALGVPGAMTEEQTERFLFYRGLGDFELPLSVKTAPGRKITASNAGDQPIGATFVLNVGSKSGAFTAHRGGVAAGASLDSAAPSLDGAPSLDSFVEALGTEVTSALQATGLYTDEATAMVNTWKRQWFRTPGIRLLYLAPQAWTDASIPLTIDPPPSEMKRVMMIRVEVITPELEETDVKAAAGLKEAATEAAAREHFVALGRFAEPRLRRALSLVGDPAVGASFLAEIATAKTTIAAGE